MDAAYLAMGIQLAALLHQFDAACRAADDLAEAATAHFEQHPDAAIITSFPGLGNLTGARVLAEIGDDRSRFADARGLKAFAGSAPITRASGKKTVVLQPAHQKPAPGRRRPHLGAGIATRLAGRLQYVPRVLVTDKLASYGVAHRQLMGRWPTGSRGISTIAPRTLISPPDNANGR